MKNLILTIAMAIGLSLPAMAQYGSEYGNNPISIGNPSSSLTGTPSDTGCINNPSAWEVCSAREVYTVDGAPKVTTVFSGEMNYTLGSVEKVGSIEITIRVPNYIAIVKVFDENGNQIYIRGMPFDKVEGTFGTINEYNLWQTHEIALEGNLNDPDGRRTSGVFWDRTNKDSNKHINGSWNFSLDSD